MRKLGGWPHFGLALALHVCVSSASAFGQLLGPEFQVNSYTTGYQTTPAVGMDGAGKFVVVWTRVDPDLTDREIAVQRFDAGGVPEGGESQANSFTTGNQWFPALATAPAGGFLPDGWLKRDSEGCRLEHTRRANRRRQDGGGEASGASMLDRSVFP